MRQIKKSDASRVPSNSTRISGVIKQPIVIKIIPMVLFKLFTVDFSVFLKNREITKKGIRLVTRNTNIMIEIEALDTNRIITIINDIIPP